MSDTPQPSTPAPLWPDASLEELLALAGQKYALEFEPVSAGGVTLQIIQIADMRERLDRAIAENALEDALHTLPLWAKIWPASLILGHVLRRIPMQGRTFLEIGAGCGVTGLVAAALGFAKVCITDINEDALLFARINILKNGLGGVAEVRRVDLLSDRLPERFSCIAGSEVLYLGHLYGPLVKFLKRHLALPGVISDSGSGSAAGSGPTSGPSSGMIFGPGSEQGPATVPEILLATDHRRNAKAFFKRAEKEFRVEHRNIGARESSTDGPEGGEERHLLTVHRLTPLR